MRLIGTLKSPYVRRTAISLEMLGVAFERVDLSTYQNVEPFSAINPVLKAPTLVCDDEDVIMDSSLILQFVESALAPDRSLWSSDPLALQQEMRAVSLALAACDKTVQIIHETQLRPEPLRLPSWYERIVAQATAAFELLEADIRERRTLFLPVDRQACITAAVVWSFAKAATRGLFRDETFPHLTALTERMESLPTFVDYRPAAR